MWLELIHLRAAVASQDALSTALGELQQRWASDENGVELRLFRHASLATDFAVHLMHRSEVAAGRSALGLRITAALKEFGMTDSSVWIEEDSP